MKETLKQQISAFVDGELPANESELLVRRLCQDADLRSLAAEYLAIGRAVRGDIAIPGMHELRGRIDAALGDGPPMEPDVEIRGSNRLLRPVAGVAIAASVALVALLGLQRVGPEDTVGVAQMSNDLAAVAIDEAPLYTEPPATDFVSDRPSERLARYYRYHSERAADMGGSGIFTRLVGLELRGGELGSAAPASSGPSPDAAESGRGSNDESESGQR